MRIELRPLSDIQPYPNNPRNNDDAVDIVATSIREFGFRQPIVVDAEGVIVVGHTRHKAALKLELKHVPVHMAQDLTPKQAKAYCIADNQTSSIADWEAGVFRGRQNRGRQCQVESDVGAAKGLLMQFDGDRLYREDTPPPRQGAHQARLQQVERPIRILGWCMSSTTRPVACPRDRGPTLARSSANRSSSEPCRPRSGSAEAT